MGTNGESLRGEWREEGQGAAKIINS